MTSASERGWPTLYVHLRYERPEEAIAWLVRAFAFNEVTRASRPEGRLIVAELEGPAGGTVMVATLDDDFKAWMRERVETTRIDAIVPYPWLGSVASLLVDDVDEHWRQSRNEGATILDPPRDQPWGIRSYAALDVEGHQWQFAEQREKVPPEAWGATRH
jgi:uncharacterized glyoxalase superfamily protein PhnB